MTAAASAPLTWPQVLAWRLRRQYVHPPGGVDAVEVVRRLAGVQAQVASSVELAIRLRQSSPTPGEIRRVLLGNRSLMKTWAMRGTLHLLPTIDAGDYLSLMASLRSWERPAWSKAFGVSPADVEALGRAVRDALDGGRTLTRQELIAEIVARTGSDHLRDVLGSGWGAVLKPLAWQGILCHGPMQGTRVTFANPEVWLPAWPGMPSPTEAAPRVIRAYLRAHGPATPAASVQPVVARLGGSGVAGSRVGDAGAPWPKGRCSRGLNLPSTSAAGTQPADHAPPQGE